MELNYIKSLQIERFFLLGMAEYQNFLDGRYGTWNNLVSRAGKLYHTEILETGKAKGKDAWIRTTSVR